MERTDDLWVSFTSSFNVDFRFRCLKASFSEGKFSGRPRTIQVALYILLWLSLLFREEFKTSSHLSAKRWWDLNELFRLAKGLYLLLSSIIGLQNIKGTLSYRCNQSVNLKPFPPELMVSKFNFTVSSCVLRSHKSITIHLIQGLLSL